MNKKNKNDKRSSGEAGRQPDFGACFHISEPHCVRYELRNDENLFHDLSYLSSYIHDARTTPSQITFQRKRLRIRMERDCWERYKHLGELVSVPSCLNVSPVLNIEWKFQYGVLTRLMTEEDDSLWITDLSIEETYNILGAKQMLLRISGSEFWSLLVYLEPRPWKILLRDQEKDITDS